MSPAFVLTPTRFPDTKRIESVFKTAVSPAGMAEAVQAQVPAIRNTVRLDGPNKSLFAAGDRRFEENKVFYTDSTFLQVFSFPLVKEGFPVIKITEAPACTGASSS